MSDGTNSAPTKGRETRLAASLVILGALARLIPHPANFTPVGGMSLLAGARLRGWHAYAIPLLLMAATDPLLSMATGFSAFNQATPFIYASFLINVWIGRRFLQGSRSPGRIALAATVGSVQFFVITNAVWFQIGGTYPHTWAGFLASYVAGLPFFGRTLSGDLAYTGLLFGLHEWLSRRAPIATRNVVAASESRAS